jgi:hypothetical protein
MQYSHMRFVFADADFLPELGSDVRYTPTFSVYQRGKKVCVCVCVFLCGVESLDASPCGQVDQWVGTNTQALEDRAWLWS